MISGGLLVLEFPSTSMSMRIVVFAVAFNLTVNHESGFIKIMA